jgi:hypothetical protein
MQAQIDCVTIISRISWKAVFYSLLLRTAIRTPNDRLTDGRDCPAYFDDDMMMMMMMVVTTTTTTTTTTTMMMMMMMMMTTTTTTTMTTTNSLIQEVIRLFHKNALPQNF